MVKPEAHVTVRNVWLHLKNEAYPACVGEPLLAKLFGHILDHNSFDAALAAVLASKVADAASGLNVAQLFSLFHEACKQEGDIGAAAKKDLLAVMDRDPAVKDARTPFLYFKGYHALQTHRIAHHLWNGKRRDLAQYLQSQSSRIFQVDIHPNARLGCGVMLDHATGLVVGETAVIEDDVSILHGVTLGGTGKAGQDRHPKIRKGVLIGAGATILGNIVVGEGARVAAGSVVLMPVPAHTTVAGVPAKVVGKAGCAKPGAVMDQVTGVQPALPEARKYSPLETGAARR